MLILHFELLSPILSNIDQTNGGETSLSYKRETLIQINIALQEERFIAELKRGARATQESCIDLSDLFKGKSE